MAKLLLVEDDKNLREIYGTRLAAEGYTIVSAGDGEEALALALKERPDLIISDVMMPKISGFDMLDILRSTAETRDVKVIMMTALSSDDQRKRGESLGANRYLVKSQVGIEDVVHTVHEVLGDSVASATPSDNTQRSESIVAPAAPGFSAEPGAQPPLAPSVSQLASPVPAVSGSLAPTSTPAPAPIAPVVATPAPTPVSAPTIPDLIATTPGAFQSPVIPVAPLTPGVPATNGSTVTHPSMSTTSPVAAGTPGFSGGR